MLSAPAMSDYLVGSEGAQPSGDKFVVWIDEVGAFLMFLKNEITVGGPAADGAGADLALLANLSRRHATLARSGERYLLEAHAPVHVAGRPVHDRVDLADGSELALGANVRLRFRIPSAMSGTARLDFASDHRPTRAVDAVILMDDTCLIGPTAENHIRCPGWRQSVLLFRRDGKLWCKSREEIFLDGRHAPDGGRLESGMVVTGAEVRFRIEEVL
jgi:hypothetical protein